MVSVVGAAVVVATRRQETVDWGRTISIPFISIVAMIAMTVVMMFMMTMPMSVGVSVTAVCLAMSVVVTVVADVGMGMVNGLVGNRMVGSSLPPVMMMGRGGLVCWTYSAIWYCAHSAVCAVGTGSVAHAHAIAICTVGTVALSSGSQVEWTGIRQYTLLTRPRARVIRIDMSRTRLAPIGLHRDRRTGRGLEVEVEVVAARKEKKIEVKSESES